jgi:hypothetical protein
MNVRELNEALSEFQKDKAVDWEDLDDILKNGVEIAEEDMDEYIATIFDDIYDGSRIVKLWSDIEGDTDNYKQIIDLMKDDLLEYIPSKIQDWKEV